MCKTGDRTLLAEFYAKAFDSDVIIVMKIN